MNIPHAQIYQYISILLKNVAHVSSKINLDNMFYGKVYLQQHADQ